MIALGILIDRLEVPDEFAESSYNIESHFYVYKLYAEKDPRLLNIE